MLDAAGFLTFTSDPRIPDTDGDGMTDAEEVNLDERFQQGDVRLYPVFSDPRAVDTDGDGLDDLSEADAGSRARSNETDGDGLGDLQELEIGTDPTLVDTDGDGYGDGEEDLNRAGGFDPLATTHVQSTLDYVGDFILGATCGELLGFLCQRDSVAWLAGNVAGGFFVVTDVRDAIGLLFQGDLVGAGLSILSVIPIGGDALGVVAKAVKFIRRVSSHAGEALKVMMKSDLPRFAKLKLLDDIAGAATSRMRTLGVTDDALERLGRAGLDLHVLDEAMQGARAVVRNGDGFVQWRDAERILRETEGGAGKGFSTIANGKGTQGYRFVDAWVGEPHNIAREAKTGFTRLSDFVRRQIDKDVLLRDRGVFSEVEWHFFPSARSDTLGPSKELLDELNAKGIPYVIHVP